METSTVMQTLTLALQEYWRLLGPAAPYYLWLASGGVGLMLWLWASHALMRKLLGHRKFRGTWFDRDQLQDLVNILHEDQASGRRVMRRDEILLLREWTQGKGYRGLGFDRKNGY